MANFKLGAICDSRGYENSLDGWEKKKLPYATSTALTRTAKRMQTAFIDAMRQDFDRPTPYVLAGTFVKPATASILTATVGWKNWAAKATPASVFMLPQVEGGPRNMKSTEKMLAKSGYLPSAQFIVPGTAAKLDQYGNMSRGQLVQILSALHSFPETGYLANRINRKKGKGRKQPQFFIGAPGGGRMPLGVWQRDSEGAIHPILIFVKSPSYKILIPFQSISQNVYTASFQEEFDRAMRDMLILSPFLEAA